MNQKISPDPSRISVTQQLEAMISKHPYKLSIRPKNRGKFENFGIKKTIENHAARDLVIIKDFAF